MKQLLVFQPIIIGLIIFLSIYEIDGATVVRDGKKINAAKNQPLNIAVIGAG